MLIQETIVETTEYRLVLVLPDSRKILAISDGDGYRLPSIGVPQWTRPAEQLQKAIHKTWKLHVLVLDFVDGSPICAVAEVFVSDQPAGFKAVSLEQLQISGAGWGAGDADGWCRSVATYECLRRRPTVGHLRSGRKSATLAFQHQRCSRYEASAGIRHGKHRTKLFESPIW
jgi:hypothetical protein